MNDYNLRLPCREDIKKINVLKKYGSEAFITDFAMLLGGSGKLSKNKDENKVLCSYYYTSDISYSIFSKKPKYVYIVDYKGKINTASLDFSSGGIRPILKTSNFDMITSKSLKNDKGILEVEFGEYPSYALNEDMQALLDERVRQNNYTILDKTYTINKAPSTQAFNKTFIPHPLRIYEIDGEKYVHVLANFQYNKVSVVLSNKLSYKIGDYVWVKVTPIRWLVDQSTKTLITKDVISSGINYKYSLDDIDLNDQKYLTVKDYLNKYLIKDIINE